MVEVPLQYLLSAREYELLRKHLLQKSPSGTKEIPKSLFLTPPSRLHDFNASSFRSALRLFLGLKVGLKAWEAISARLAGRKSGKAPRTSSIALVAPSTKLAFSFASMLFLHRILFRALTRLRLQLLHEKTKRIREQYPKLYAALTARIAPAIGGSLAGLALGICPADQLRVTIAIYLMSRGLEFFYAHLTHLGYFRDKPWWFGSWLLFSLAQGQLLHAFVFDRDCFPSAYGDFILKYTPDYIQRRPADLSAKVSWPNSNQIVDSLADMARANWPPFVSPILHPANKNPLPPTINPIVSSITSRAHPAITHLSCALIHPSEPSCFTAYLQQNIQAFPKLVRFFTLYYGALSVLRAKQFYRQPFQSLNKLAAQILKTTASISGAIGASWGTICLFNAILPRAFIPQFRFFLGGLLGGGFQILDRGSAGHGNSLYAARTSVDSLWKVGVKRRWWRSVKSGDVYLFVAALALCSAVSELEGEGVIDKVRGKWIFKVFRGEADLGLGNEDMNGKEQELEKKE